MVGPYGVNIVVERDGVRLKLHHRGIKRKELSVRAKGWFDDNDPLLECDVYKRDRIGTHESWRKIRDRAFLTAMSANEPREMLEQFANVLLDYFATDVIEDNSSVIEETGARLVRCDRDWLLKSSGSLP